MANQMVNVFGINLIFNNNGVIHEGEHYDKASYGVDYNETCYCALYRGNYYITIEFNSEDTAMDCVDEINRRIEIAKSR
jgi:hypothetical protein